MQRIAIAAPIKPGKTEAWLQYIAELKNEWETEWKADFRKFGIDNESAWLQKTPNGDLAILLWEVRDPELHRQQFEELMTSNEDFHVWSRNNLMDIFGFEPAQERPPLPEQVAHFEV